MLILKDTVPLGDTNALNFTGAATVTETPGPQGAATINIPTVAGPTGATGPAGPTGATGPVGATGATGATGAAGGGSGNYAHSASTTAGSSAATFPLATTPQNTDGAAYASLDTTITPSNAASLLQIDVSIPLIDSDASNGNFCIGLFRDAVADTVMFAYRSINGANGAITLTAVVAANAAVATTFKLRYGVLATSGATAYIMRDRDNNVRGNGTVQASMIVREIAP